MGYGSLFVIVVNWESRNFGSKWTESRGPRFIYVAIQPVDKSCMSCFWRRCTLPLELCNNNLIGRFYSSLPSSLLRSLATSWASLLSLSNQVLFTSRSTSPSSTSLSLFSRSCLCSVCKSCCFGMCKWTDSGTVWLLDSRSVWQLDSRALGQYDSYRQ